jgi:predicted permease
MSFRILTFTVLISIASAALSSLMPVFYAGRVPVNEILKEEGRSGTSGGRSHRTRSLLVVFEVALTTVALIGAGLFLRSFNNARQLNPGFNSDRVLVAQMFLSYAGYNRDQEKLFNRNLKQRLETAPGVENAAYANAIPLWFGDPPSERIRIEGIPEQAGIMNVGSTVISPGYFGLMRIPLLEGRDFTDLDDGKAPLVVIVNQTFARRFFGGENPLGRKVITGDRPRTIVGLVKDSKYGSPAERPRPYFYSPFQQRFGTGQHNAIYIRTSADMGEARAILRREVAALDAASGLYDAMPLTEYTQASLYPQKVAAIMLGALATLSLLLAAMGLYSVMSYAVNERRREIGIRMALGASRLDVLGSVLRKALMLTGVGLITGFVAALVSARLVGSLLVQIDASDPLTYAGAAGFLTWIAVVAAYVPARRAIGVDPVSALRQ